MRTIYRYFAAALSDPAFAVVGVILVVAAVGLTGATERLKLHFRKEPVPLARSLKEIPKNLGPWRQISVDEPLTHDVQEALATNEYVFRLYVDSRVVGEARSAQLVDAMMEYRKALADYQVALKEYQDSRGKSLRPMPPTNPMGSLRAEHPEAFVDASVTYYTGLVDTVAHIPERCYVADGYEPSVTEDVSCGALRGRNGTGLIRYVTFEDSTPERQSVTRNVGYVFQCNGQYNSDSIAVRKRLADLFQRYGYYMKVEVQTLSLPQKDASRVMSDFLASLLPETEKCVADWSAFAAR